MGMLERFALPLQAAAWIPWVPLAGAVLCALCATNRKLAPKASVVCVVSLVSSLFITLLIAGGVSDWSPTADASAFTAHVGTWISVGGFTADWSYFIDPLTMVMLGVVLGVGTLIAIYAGGYMKGERGYARFFAAVCLFIFAMTTLVMGGNLLLTFLGWEGVGLASYLLIGFDYHKDEARAAAIKAFVVNRIGDAGFLLGIFCVYRAFGTIEYATLLPAAQGLLDESVAGALTGPAAEALAQARTGTNADAYLIAAPFLIMLGAFGKSAQFPLYTWLPDAMAGPTPVSALIHAATMVTSGIYLLARLMPVFEQSAYALPTVGVIAAGTSLIAALIALQQYDLKKVFAYSTVSQLGYMFLGVAALAPGAGVFHLTTHACFKALLFLTAGNVMHALAGNLDIRTMSGLGRRLPVTKWLMLAGCVSLAALPLTAGFVSKESIVAALFDFGHVHEGDAFARFGTLYAVLGVLSLITAFLTASYAFRVWFQVFCGDEHIEMGDEHHGDAHDAAHPAEPHEMPLWPMNAPLILLAAGALLAGLLLNGTALSVMDLPETVAKHSTAQVLTGDHAYHGDHAVLFAWSIGISLTAVLLAAFLHWGARDARDGMAEALEPVLEPARERFWLDEAYHAALVQPLRGAAQGLKVVDALVQWLVRAVVGLPEAVGALWLTRLQSGRLQGYALGMAGGVAVVAVLMMIVLMK